MEFNNICGIYEKLGYPYLQALEH